MRTVSINKHLKLRIMRRCAVEGLPVSDSDTSPLSLGLRLPISGQSGLHCLLSVVDCSGWRSVLLFVVRLVGRDLGPTASIRDVVPG